MNTDLILQNVSKHITLDEAEKEFFLSILLEKKIKRKEFVLKPGEICRMENFVTSGCLRIYSVDDNGAEHIGMFAIEDWWVSDMYSFLTQTPATYFIDAVEDSTVLQISKENLDRLFDRVPKFDRFFRILLQNAFIAQQRRINQNLSFTAEDRYLNFIKAYPQLEKRIPQKQISAYLGITPEFLSMLRRKLAGR
jgi:CRP-like cAMP-binding protein